MDISASLLVFSAANAEALIGVPKLAESCRSKDEIPGVEGSQSCLFAELCEDEYWTSF